MKEQVTLLRLPAVKAQTGLSKSTIYDSIKKSQFPSPIQLSERCVAWPSTAIDKWIAERIAGKEVLT